MFPTMTSAWHAVVKVWKTSIVCFINRKLIMESLILTFLQLHLGWVSSKMDNMEEYMELDKCMLDTDRLVLGSSVHGEEVAMGWPGLDPIHD